ncbi:MAG: 50S ribosomal protein L6 [Candidatus Cloacimonetes bacterium]|nr:50S ribosomal protein L6 [Candidatus Cloacimonadota bacterium]
MSRIGKTPIKLPAGVKITLDGRKIKATGKLGELEYVMCDGISFEEKDGILYFERRDDSREQKAYHGLTRALVNNMVIGVSEGFEKTLQVIGTGYSAERIGPWVKLILGYSHEILMEVPENLDVNAQVIPRREQGKLGVQAVITVKGIHKEDVGKFAAEIRNCRPPENYKGKGIRYLNEWVLIKPGKSGTK